MRYMVISSDCHAGLPTAEYRDYLDPQYRPTYDEWFAEQETNKTQLSLANPDFIKKWEEENEEGLRGSWDAEHRDKELDADGVVGEVLFPNADATGHGVTTAPFGAGLGMSGAHDPELLAAGAHAHNRWLVELCATSRDRRAGMALLPQILADPQAAIAEMTWARDNGLRGVLIPNMWTGYAPYHDARYEVIWAASAALGMPIHTHSGGSPNDYGSDNPGMMSAEYWFYPWRPLWFLLWSGVFERHPNLKFIAAESGAFPAPNLLWHMDLTFMRDHNSKKFSSKLEAKLKMKPSEYFDRNCFLGASTTKRREIAMRYEIGVGNIMWGNDFPHPEGTWPHTAEWLKKTFFDIPIEETEQMLGLTAAKVYGFDVEKLRPLADRIGPTPEDLGQTDESAFARWNEAAKVGRHWITGADPIPVNHLG